MRLRLTYQVSVKLMLNFRSTICLMWVVLSKASIFDQTTGAHPSVENALHINSSVTLRQVQLVAKMGRLSLRQRLRKAGKYSDSKKPFKLKSSDTFLSIDAPICFEHFTLSQPQSLAGALVGANNNKLSYTSTKPTQHCRHAICRQTTILFQLVVQPPCTSEQLRGR